MKKLETINDNDNIYPGPTDDDVRNLLGIDPTRCRHGYVHTRYCASCIQALLAIAMDELKFRGKKK